jgi:HK97 family phage prohead protease
MPKLLEYHDDTRVIGRVTERVSTDDGLMFVATLSKTRAADDALALLADQSISAVSIGAVPLKFKRVNGVMEVSEARMIELSLVSFGAFAEAEIESVYASQAEDPEEIPEEETPPQPSEEDDIMSEPTTVEAAIATQPIYATLKKEVKIPTAVEYLAAAISGGDKWKAFSEVLKAAAPDVDLAVGPGVLPELIVAPVYNNFQGLRPVVDAVGVRSMPAAGQTFIRPKVTTHNSMGAQANDLDTLTASTMVVSAETVTKGTYGGYVSISEQLLDWSEPSMLTVLLDDMARIYANTTDNVAADALVAGATTTGAFGDPTVPADWLAWIGASSTTILTASNGNNPNTLFCSADVFGDLIALSDTAGRPLFPNLNAQNAMGAVAVTSDVGTAFGCRVVRDRNFAANTLILGDSSGFEIFESQKGAISVDVPSTLSRTIAFRGYFATLMIDLDKFVKASGY